MSLRAALATKQPPVKYRLLRQAEAFLATTLLNFCEIKRGSKAAPEYKNTYRPLELFDGGKDHRKDQDHCKDCKENLSSSL
jgi:hypothetical protein